MICLDTCSTASDTVCQDGGWAASGNWCDFGTDCTDCGSRLLLDPPPSPPSFPPSPSAPPSAPWEDTSIEGGGGDDVTCNVFCADTSLGFEIYILLGGLGLTAAVLCFAAYSKVQVKLSGADILSTLLAAASKL